MQLCVFEDKEVRHLHPLTATRAVYDLRVARYTLLERICNAFNSSSPQLHVRPALASITAQEHPGYLINQWDQTKATLFVNGRFMAANEQLVQHIRSAAEPGTSGRVFLDGDTVVAAWVPKPDALSLINEPITQASFAELPTETVQNARFIHRLWDLIGGLPKMLEKECLSFLQTHGPRLEMARLEKQGVIAVNPDQIHCADTATIKPGVILNAEDGPIVIDEHATVMERAVLRGPLYLGPHSQVKIGGRIENSAFGTYSKVGGEVSHSVIHSYSNKAHDGFMGHSYLGRWCNLAADTNTSNLKNDYGEISLYNAVENRFERSGQNFLGLFMGDHSKCGINTMFNTGTIVGVFCNIFGVNYPPRHIPSFSWGGNGNFTPYHLPKALQVAETVMKRRSVTLSDAERQLLQSIYAQVHELPKETETT